VGGGVQLLSQLCGRLALHIWRQRRPASGRLSHSQIIVQRNHRSPAGGSAPEKQSSVCFDYKVRTCCKWQCPFCHDCSCCEGLCPKKMPRYKGAWVHGRRWITPPEEVVERVMKVWGGVHTSHNNLSESHSCIAIWLWVCSSCQPSNHEGQVYHGWLLQKFRFRGTSGAKISQIPNPQTWHMYQTFLSQLWTWPLTMQ